MYTLSPEEENEFANPFHNKVQIILAVRRRTGLGLVEAKEVYDTYAAKKKPCQHCDGTGLVARD